MQAELILTRRLLYSNGVQLYSDLPGAPEMDNAVVVTLGETSSDTTQRNGRIYGVVQQRYAIFPETSGEFVIPGISITASVRLVEGSRVSRKGVRVATEETRVQVRPVPQSYPADASWLPAREVRLLQVTSPENTVHNVGDTLTHELLVDVQGNIGSIAPPLPLALSDTAFRVYPQAPVINDDAQGDSVRGSRLQTTSVLPLQPGNLVVPEVAVTWWDTEQDRLRVTTAPAQILSVIGEAVNTSAPADQVAQPSAEQTDAPASESAAAPQGIEVSWNDLRTPLAIAAVIGLILLLVLALLRPGRAGSTRASRQPTTAQRRKALQQALLAGNAHNIHSALQRYVSALYDESPAQAVHRFAQSSDEARRGYEALLECLYGSDQPQLTSDSINDLQNAIGRDRATRRRIRTAPASLPELYAP